MNRTKQQAALRVIHRFLSPVALMHERSATRCTLLYPAASLLLVVLLFQITGRQITMAEQALMRYRQEAAQYRQTADTYQATVQAIKRGATQVPRQALQALLERQTVGKSYE